MRDRILLAIKHNASAGIFLQMVAISVVCGYYFVPEITHFLTKFADYKVKYGVFYAVVSTAIFGGLLPFLLLVIRGEIKNRKGHHFLFYIVLWGAMGALIDNFYALQSFLFSDNRDMVTIVQKTLFDQFVFTVFITCPLLTILYYWRDSHYCIGGAVASFSWSEYRQDYLVTLVSNWLIWIPAVTLVYMMPTSLQIPFFNLILCFFVMMLTFLNSRENK